MTKRGLSLLSLSCLFLLVLQLTGCGGGAFSSISTPGGGGGVTAASVTTTSLPGGTMGTAYSADLKASGGKQPYSWSLKAGSLPAGLSLSKAGAITGTPTGQGTFSSLVFQVTDASDSSADSSALSIKINPALLRVMTSSLPNSEVGAAYSAVLQGIGGTAPYKWSLKSGQLPSGLTLNAATGAITGVPASAGTVASLVFQLIDANQDTADSGSLSVQVITAPSIETASLPPSEVGAAYSASLQATGGTGSYTWSLKSGRLPSGLSFGANGVVSGTPTVSGNFGSLVFQVIDTNSVKALSGQLSIQTVAGPSVLTGSLPASEVGAAYSASLQATGGSGSYSWALKSGTLPAGLTIAADGLVSGTPTTPGNFGSLVFQVSDTNHVNALSGQLNIQTASAPTVVTTYLPADNAGTAYSLNLQVNGGTAPYKWSLQSGVLPAGLSLNPSTGAITGTPTTPTLNALVFQVTDSFTVTAASNGLSLQIYNVHGCSAGAESNLGTQPYAFLIKGFDPNGSVAIAGSFIPDGNGNITGGNEDSNRTTGAQSAAITSGSYTLGGDNRGCLYLTTASSTATYRYSVGGVNGSGQFTTGQLAEFDDSNGSGTRGSGILRLQTTSVFSAGLSGMYAFLLTGGDSAGGHVGMVGSLSTSGGNVTNLAMDYDDAGATGSGLTGGTGTYTIADSNGRGTAAFSIANYNLHMVFYMVNASEVIFASTDALPIPITGGEALATSGPFSAANLSGNYVAHGVGLAVNDTPVATITTASFDGVSIITGGDLFTFKAGVASEWGVQGGYTVDANTGRVVFTGNFIAPVGYLVTGVPGVSVFVTGNDFPATSGVASVQTSVLPSGGRYTFGTEEDVDYSVVNLVGDFKLNTGDFAGTQDMNIAASPFLVENQVVFSTPYNFAANGTGTFGANTAAITDGNAIYVINESPTVMHPSVTVLVK